MPEKPRPLKGRSMKRNRRVMILHPYPLPREAADRAANGERVKRGQIGSLEFAFYEYQNGLDAIGGLVRCNEQLPPPLYISRLV